ncbi:GntR family transcriptional regulator [Roseinatronobacter sp. S2]|uniref:GntR family transcriptional regulator n=1 Tax=Roseinatronobacter sp. S2 TaxID=3035471 RepID=UPI00240EFCA0|nr:GntR family transcriptional regulator [Roseinatronobacter sp. S2]WFE76516.1 GntR family transcriptional regulator [Roseinatronobacter sp. S2]
MSMHAIGATALNSGQPLGAQLLAILRARIIRGDLPPGSRLSEAGIASELQISRQPIREAFIKLAEEGLLEIRPQRGTVVPKISLRMVDDARFVREAIEADVVKIAAQEFDAARIATLDRLLLEQSQTDSVEGFIALDDQFHRHLSEGVGRSHAWHVIEALKAQLDRVRYLSVQQFPKDTLVEQHASIVEAIRTHDPAQAEAAMRAHLSGMISDLPKIAAERAEFFEPQP